MKIPLIAKTVIDKYDNSQKIEIWRNGKPEWIKSPFLPFFYSSYELNPEFVRDAVIEKQNKILLSTLEEKELFKYSFPNTKYVNQYRESDSIESDMLFTDRILIDQPDFFLKYPNENNLKVLFFDIEVDTIGMFPTPKRNAIIAIGVKCGERKAIFTSKTYKDDKEILEKFFKFLKEVDPDIIAHYNGNRFDIPYINERCKINNIKTYWGRDGKLPYVFKGKMTLGGRISFDIYNEVERDQTLFGIKNHRMKTIAKWLKFDDVVEVPYTEMRSMINTDKLKEYLISDVLITEKLFNIYFKNVKMVAEMLNIPLNLMVDAAPSFIAKIIHGRGMQKLNIVADKNNGQRHPIYIKKKQGALTDTLAPGLYNHTIFKVDFGSQYPNIVRTFNISPETVRILRYDIFTGQYKFDISNPNKYIFSVPDSVANKNIVISIDMTKRGFLANFMDEMLNERSILKKQMKELKKGTIEYEGLHVRQNAIKIFCNLQTGYEGQEHAHFGDLGSYCLITSLGRFYLKMAMEGMKNG